MRNFVSSLFSSEHVHEALCHEYIDTIVQTKIIVWALVYEKEESIKGNMLIVKLTLNSTQTIILAGQINEKHRLILIRKDELLRLRSDMVEKRQTGADPLLTPLIAYRAKRLRTLLRLREMIEEDDRSAEYSLKQKFLVGAITVVVPPHYSRALPCLDPPAEPAELLPLHALSGDGEHLPAVGRALAYFPSSPPAAGAAGAIGEAGISPEGPLPPSGASSSDTSDPAHPPTRQSKRRTSSAPATPKQAASKRQR